MPGRELGRGRRRGCGRLRRVSSAAVAAILLLGVVASSCRPPGPERGERKLEEPGGRGQASVARAQALRARGQALLAGIELGRAVGADFDNTVAMIRALGGEATAKDDGFVVQGKRPLTGRPVGSAQDHRIAMAAGVLALSVPGVTVTGAEAVEKSFPRFFEVLSALTE